MHQREQVVDKAIRVVEPEKDKCRCYRGGHGGNVKDSAKNAPAEKRYLQDQGQGQSQDRLADDDHHDILEDIEHRYPEQAQAGVIEKLRKQSLVVLKTNELRRSKTNINRKEAQPDAIQRGD